jgi:hypothetical protein
MGETARIIPRPIDVGWLRRCPSCKRSFAMQEISREKRGTVTVVKYRCRHCAHEREHGDSHPRGVL